VLQIPLENLILAVVITAQGLRALFCTLQPVAHVNVTGAPILGVLGGSSSWQAAALPGFSFCPLAILN